MDTTPPDHAHDRVLPLSSSAVVFGLHWAPVCAPARQVIAPANLDALCELHDAGGARLEVIGPARRSSIDGSVVHTGDSLTGASSWDDERVFVFLDALRAEVQSVAFFVLGRDGRRFCDVPGAQCHVTDYTTEDALLSVRLTAVESTEYGVATLHRTASGWILRSHSSVAERSRASVPQFGHETRRAPPAAE